MTEADPLDFPLLSVAGLQLVTAYGKRPTPNCIVLRGAGRYTLHVRGRTIGFTGDLEGARRRARELLRGAA